MDILYVLVIVRDSPVTPFSIIIGVTAGYIAGIWTK